jgi:hypothetical protein
VGCYPHEAIARDVIQDHVCHVDELACKLGRQEGSN